MNKYTWQIVGRKGGTYSKRRYMLRSKGRYILRWRWMSGHHTTLSLCNTLRCDAVWCNVMQWDAALCNTLQHTATKRGTKRGDFGWVGITRHCRSATHCIDLQHTAKQCVTLHHTASHCITPQQSAAHRYYGKLWCVIISNEIFVSCLFARTSLVHAGEISQKQTHLRSKNIQDSPSTMFATSRNKA